MQGSSLARVPPLKQDVGGAACSARGAAAADEHGRYSDCSDGLLNHDNNKFSDGHDGSNTRVDKVYDAEDDADDAAAGKSIAMPMPSLMCRSIQEQQQASSDLQRSMQSSSFHDEQTDLEWDQKCLVALEQIEGAVVSNQDGLAGDALLHHGAGSMPGAIAGRTQRHTWEAFA